MLHVSGPRAPCRCERDEDDGVREASDAVSTGETDPRSDAAHAAETNMTLRRSWTPTVAHV